MERNAVDYRCRVGGAGRAVWPADTTASDYGGSRPGEGAGSAHQTPVASLATQEPPVRPEVDLEQWKEEVKNELQDQLAALGRTLVAELRQQCAPGPVAPSSVNESLLIYLDDIIVYSSDFQAHLKHLEGVFQ
ncbi:hypothetical protein SKAU_G00269640 [Synaphobranchus kaupii]|uniref:Uncharacterized protein n=1 Tax=Synaphobranchus kaupii TaxID=118154 RepID=A0A9Q1IPJ3_SYNKA|nr:hypothetical protein SKAU_G00269640 [Synaphobranchus kaupii]